MERKFPGKKVSKIWVYLARLSSFLEILEKAAPFATECCRKFKPDIWLNGKCPLFSIDCFSFPFLAPRFSSILKATLINGEFASKNHIVLQ